MFLNLYWFAAGIVAIVLMLIYLNLDLETCRGFGRQLPYTEDGVAPGRDWWRRWKQKRSKDAWYLNAEPYQPRTFRSRFVIALGYLFYYLRLVTAKELGNLKVNLFFAEQGFRLAESWNGERRPW